MLKYDKIKRSTAPYTYQGKEAIALHVAAGVPQGPCGLEEVALFQEHLAGEYQLVVISADAMYNIVYTGPISAPRIYLLFRINHWDLITSLSGFYAASYSCNKCHKTYACKNGHHCVKVCSACLSDECNSSGHLRIRCGGGCNRYFKGDACLDMHRANGTCQSRRRCLMCGFEHEKKQPCNQIMCRNYDKYVNRRNHQYYVPKPGPDETLAPIYFYYDIEAYTTPDGVHVANLLIVQNERGETFTFKNINDACN